MKFNAVQSLVYHRISNIVTEDNFKLVKKEEGFVKRILDGKQTLGVALYNYEPVFKISLAACIRIDAVEEIFHLFSGISTEYHSQNYTTTTSFEYFTKNNVSEYTVSSEAELDSAMNEISEIIQRKFIPFFSKYDYVDSLDEAINCDKSELIPFDCTLQPWSAVHAVIVAYLSGNKEYEHLLRKYRKENGPFSESHPFNLIVEHLKTYRQ